MIEVWHYAAWQGRETMEPIHDIRPRIFAGGPNVEHIITIERGKVTCWTCKRMMGMPYYPTWDEWYKKVSDKMLDRSKHLFDWSEWIGSWSSERPATCEEEFEALRRSRMPLSRANMLRVKHLEMHLDRGDVVCNCGKEGRDAEGPLP